ncbi:protein ROLLING AND ERECT LEAF 2-like [Carex rostrata]
MGCSTSRARNEDTVRRCRDRRNLMDTTTQSLHHLASAHAAYLHSLRHTAAAFTVFSSGEPLVVSDLTPPISIQYPVSPSPQKPVGLENEENGRNLVQKKDVEVRMVVRHRNLAEIAAAIAECFVKASVAGEAVLELLQNGQEEKKMVHYSNGLLKVLSSRSRSRKLQDMRRRLETAGIQGSVEQRNHAFTLEKLFAWENRLYKEIKTRERLKIKLDKKLSTLQRLEHRGNCESTVAKTRTSINKLHSLLTVASEALSATASAIIQARDSELAPQLLELCQGNLKMWQRMNHLHDAQYQIIQQVNGVVSSSLQEETSDLHHAATGELEIALSKWQMTFSHLMKCQRSYIRCVHIWLNRTLLEFSNDSSPAAVNFAQFCNEWKQAVDRAPDRPVSQAIQHFMNSIHIIFKKQAEEMTIKRHADKYKYKLERKSKSLRKWEKTYYKSYKHADAPMKRDFRDYRDREDYERQILDEARDREMLKKKKADIVDWLSKVEKENKRHLKAVESTRLVTLNGMKASLPGVFQAIAGFSGLIVGILEGVYRSAESVQQ